MVLAVILLASATGFATATDGSSDLPVAVDDSGATRIFVSSLAQPVDYPQPVEYYAASAEEIGLLPEDASHTAGGFEIVGQYYDTDLDQGFVAISHDDAVVAKARFEISAQRALSPHDLSEGVSTALDELDRDGVNVVMSKYNPAQISSAMEQLASHFENDGARVIFGYQAQRDTIELTGELTQADLDALPDTGVGYSFSPGYYQDDVHNENVRAPFVGGAAVFGYQQGELVRCTSGIPALNANGTRGYFTAGHCFDLLSYVWTSSSLSGASNSSSQNGDSGGSVYANFGGSVRVTGTITGHVDSPSAGSTTYVTDWRAVRDNYGARLIYG